MSFATNLGSSLRTATSTANAAASSSTAVRAFSVSARVSAKPRKQRNADDPMALRKMARFNYDDVPTLGHAILARKREVLQLMRTVEFEIPKLSNFRQTYKPPKESQCLQFRFQHYQGENHPASRKVVLNVDVDALVKAGAVPP
ncbi:hypothetical protein [Sporisorium scitamineum]|uniref:Small ribosomal subunit protein mS35 mitochondrial conserved domain-containing protein n=1 Tax=Sporisorium scitamineum TaxID=49012 RepID=A0A0F7S8L5_9BASI|nr:hypothetical protein [Sporisorium scitamineum]